jgi:FMN hydrolase / 5-amino-6-(5-phospho-D-ribitylamino)uracil phosphatase
MIEAVVFDVGGTLVREDRYWNAWADWLDVPRHTMSALVGAVGALGMESDQALRLLRPGIDIAAETHAKEADERTREDLGDADLYPDARSGLDAVREHGARVYVAGNQTGRAAALLRALDLPADGIGTSGEWGVAKPHPEFFARVLELAGSAPERTLYVGDFPDNDIVPAKAAGLRTCLIRRGPWGHLWAAEPATLAAADWRVGTLHELASLIGEERSGPAR